VKVDQVILDLPRGDLLRAAAIVASETDDGTKVRLLGVLR
jgi:hypothetical protein